MFFFLSPSRVGTPRENRPVLASTPSGRKPWCLLLSAIFLLTTGWSAPEKSQESVIRQRIAGSEKITLSPHPHLEGTDLWEEPAEDILNQQYREIENYYLQRIRESADRRDRLWQPDTSSLDAYHASLRSHRQSMRETLGVVPTVGWEAEEEQILAEDEVRAENVQIQLDESWPLKALLLYPTPSPEALMIAVPPASITRAAFLGLEEGQQMAGWLKRLLERNVAVCVPQTVLRKQDHPLSFQLKGKDRRHILHRLGFITGRTLVGLEVQQVLALSQYLRARFDLDQVGILGEDQGGMTALYAAALEDSFGPVVIKNYFQDRRLAWKEPVDRMLYGQLEEFGDAEVAALIAPRQLIIISDGEGPPESEVRSEVERARRFYNGLQKTSQLSFWRGQDQDLNRAVEKLLSGQEGPSASVPADLELKFSSAGIQEERNLHFEGLKAYLDRLVDASEEARARRWELANTPQAAREERGEALRTNLAQLLGKIEGPALAPNPRTRLIQITDDFTAYEVLLDVLPEVHAYGLLLIPRGKQGQRLPAVIAQHGLGGAPKYSTGLDPRQERAYHGFGSELARQGYVVFAPYVTVPVPQKILINRLVRQAATLGLMRTSIELQKLHRIVDFLQALPQVEPSRIGYYGLSYGGYSAIWMTPLEPRIQAVVISGHFNDWRSKVTNEILATSYLRHPDEDFYNWNVLNRLTHVELVASIWPRAVCIEYGSGDSVTPPDWHRRAWQEVQDLASRWETEDQTSRVFFDGVHEIHGVQVFDFLDRWLKPQESSGRDYVYELKPVRRDLPGLGDTSEDTLPFVTRVLDTDSRNRVRGTFHLGQDDAHFSGLSLRVSRVGQPGDLIVRYGTQAGKADLGEARLASDTIHPLYDLHYPAAVDPIRLSAGPTYHFELSTRSGWESEGHYYLLYGPKPLGGRAIHPDFGLSYHLLSDGSESVDPTTRFSFLKPYLAPFHHRPLGREPASGPGEGEIEITSRWVLRPGEEAEAPALEVAEDLENFLQEVFQLSLDQDPGPQSPLIELKQLSHIAGVESAEGYRVQVEPLKVTVSASSGRGLRRGAHWLERSMRQRAGPFLKAGEVVHNERFSPRITMPVLSGGAKITELSRPLEYTDGLLQRISHDGFNAIWLWINVEEATYDSDIFPEFNDAEAAVRLSRLADVSQRARRFGLDVYLYLATGYHHHIPDEFYLRHPDLRGYGWGNPMCTSQPIVRDYYSETVRNIFQQAPLVKGLVVIYDSEGFRYCGNDERTRLQCPRCRAHSQPYLANQILRTLKSAMQETGGQEKEFIAWNYDNESQWVLDLIPLLPKDTIIQANFSKGSIVVRDGVRHRTGDYNITSVGPPEFFVQLYQATRQHGLPMMAKTEHAISQEAIFIPYLPVMEQWYRRISRVRDFDLRGWFGNWSHYGYTPHSRPARLINQMSFDPAPSSQDLLNQLSRQDFGEKLTRPVLDAWHDFSQGITQFPYSDQVARRPGPLQKGPSHPLFLDPEIENFGRWRSWQNDLAWAVPWGPAITVKYLERVRQKFQTGIEKLNRAIQEAGAEDPEAELQAEKRVARTFASSLRTILHLVQWLQTRQQYLEANDDQERLQQLDRLEAIASAEWENAQNILPDLEVDSRLGYASEGGGVVRGGLFNSHLVRWKTGQLEDLLLLRLPELRSEIDISGSTSSTETSR